MRGQVTTMERSLELGRIIGMNYIHRLRRLVLSGSGFEALHHGRGERGGVTYPRCVVRHLVEMLEPFGGRVYNPCCLPVRVRTQTVGSAGMFGQSVEFIEAHATCNGNGGRTQAACLTLKNLKKRRLELYSGQKRTFLFLVFLLLFVIIYLYRIIAKQFNVSKLWKIIKKIN